MELTQVATRFPREWESLDLDAGGNLVARRLQPRTQVGYGGLPSRWQPGCQLFTTAPSPSIRRTTNTWQPGCQTSQETQR